VQEVICNSITVTGLSCAESESSPNPKNMDYYFSPSLKNMVHGLESLAMTSVTRLFGSYYCYKGIQHVHV